MRTSLIAILLLAAVASAQCSSLLLNGDHYRQVEQYQEITVKLVAYNGCPTANYTITPFSSLPVTIDKGSFSLGRSKAIAAYATIAPGAADPGLYTVHFLMQSKQGIAREEFVVKVRKAQHPPLVAEAPAIMRIQENKGFDFTIAVTNNGSSPMSNVMAFVDEEGQARRYSGPISVLQPGETKHISFHYGPRPRGEYTLNYTVVSGSYKFVGQATVGSSSKNYPLVTLATVKGYDSGYRISYLAKNIGPKRLDNLFLTVEDAPSDWQVISPSRFSLNPGETKEVELTLRYGKDKDAGVTAALYEGDALRAEDRVILSQSRLSGTGLFSLASSFELGLLLVLLVGVAYFGYSLRKRAMEKNIEIRSLLPEWAENLWPF